ncbi:MAG: type II toxin-antitoxin system Phd/YefM family antitoxin [Myxococcota bacterium]|nr:type II toxin-antitoxin system Phd/YefM family antitoxin [Myxococcota bacterium]
MTHETIAVSKFKATCLSMLRKVNQTRRSLLVTRNGEPIALISPPPRPEKPKSWLGSFSQTGEIIGDVISPAFCESDWEVLGK